MPLAEAEDMRPAAVETPEEPAENLSAAATLGEALLEAAAMLREAQVAALQAAPAVERPAYCHRPHRTRRSAHWPRRISNKRHCSSRVSLQLRVRIQIADWRARDTTERWIGCSRSSACIDSNLHDAGSCVDG